MKGRSPNVRPLECAFRIIIGTGLVIAALSVVSVELTVISAIAALMMAGAGIYLVATGLAGYCPIFARIGVPPLRR